MSKRKRLLSQSQGMRTNLKLALIIGAASVSGLVALLLVVFNVSRREILRASGTMEFTNAEVMQDTTAVLRGSTTNPIITILVETRGHTNSVKLNSFILALTGTSKPVSRNLENIKLFYTGNDQHFNSSSQVNITQAVALEGDFKVDLNKALLPGKNYFWLTADIKTSAVPAARVDAELKSLTVAGTSLLPLIAAPAGAKTIRGNTAYFSTGNADASDRQSWNASRDGKGAVPEGFSDPRACYFIQPGHQLELTTMREMPVVAIEEGARLAVNEMVRIHELDVNYGGVFQFNAIEIGDKCIDQLTVNDGGNFIYNGTGIYPVKTSILEKGSTVVFYQYTSQTFEPGIIWGNLLVEAKNGCSLNIAETIKNIRGNLELRNTGGNAWYADGVSVMSVGGSFIISGGKFDGVHGNNSKLVMNIANDLIVRDGELKDVENTYTSSAHTIFNIGGDVIFTGGKVAVANAESEGSAINLVGLENKAVRWIQKEKSEVELCNVTIKAEKEVSLKGDKMGNIAKGKVIIVERNARLWCSTAAVKGEGKFLLMDFATLGVGDTKGINSDKREGNILTAERAFSSGANYVYYTSSTPQETGVFTTFPKDGNIRNLIIKKDAPSQAVVLSADLFVAEQVKIGMGELNKGKFSLKLADVTESNASPLN